MLNGERAVVILFIARVITFAPVSLLYESISLSLVSLLALSVEISADVSPSSVTAIFRTRQGASSGILLGAATIPGLMVSKLIQISRAISLHEMAVEEFEYMRFLYWATSATCFSVLVFLLFILQRQRDNTLHVRRSFNWDAVFGLSCITLYAGTFYMSFAEKLEDGWHAAFMLLWALSHGLAAVKLIQNALHTFPACASIGEALLVTAGIVIYFGDMVSYTAAKVHGHLRSSKLISPYGPKRSEISTIIQGLILGLLLFPLCFKFVLGIWEQLNGSSHFGIRETDNIKRSFLFYILLAVIMTVAVPSWMQFVQDFHVHPFLWIFNFVFSEPLKRLSLCICWVVVIYPSVRKFYEKSKDSKTKRILLRKYYHLLAVLMFLPALIIQPEFLSLALGAALAVFLVLEIVRIWRIWPLGQLVHHFMNAFTDHRDSDLLIVSHFSLLLGCALPLWFSSGFNDRPLAPFAGILSLGIGDTMASMVGHKYGVIRWSKSNKTIEGTAAGITSVLAACSILLPHLATTGYIFSQHWVSLLVAVTTSGLLEAFTAQLDNAFIPLVFYSLLCL